MSILYGAKKLESNYRPTKKKALRIMNFQSSAYHSISLFRSSHILKLEDKMLIENILFISKAFNNLHPPIIKSWFTFCSDVHNYHTVSSTADDIFKPFYTTDFYGNTPIFDHTCSKTTKVTFSFLKYVLPCKNVFFDALVIIKKRLTNDLLTISVTFT